MNFAFTAAERGHAVTLYEAGNKLGGQLLMARNIPQKTEFDEMLRYFAQRLEEENVDVRLGHAPTVDEVTGGAYDEIVIATGVRPRIAEIEGIDHPKVRSYPDVLLHGKPVGARVAIIGAGGIALDMAEFLLDGAPHVPPQMNEFAHEHGLDMGLGARGGLLLRPDSEIPRREVWMLQRKETRPGAGLGASTVWIRRDKLRRHGVKVLSGVTYECIDDAGLHIRFQNEARLIEVDTIIICAGQESERGMFDEIRARASDIPVHLIGGADVAAELDALSAIAQATRLALST